jgi:hypothetical protein
VTHPPPPQDPDNDESTAADVTSVAVPTRVVDDGAEATRFRRRSALVVALAAGLLIAAVLIVLLPQREEIDDFPLRTTGPLTLQVVVARGGQAAVVQPGGVLHPGDELHFQVEGASGWLAIVGEDGAGVVALYSPGDRRMQRPPAGKTMPAATLGPVVGRQRLIVIDCAEPQAMDHLLHAVKASSAATSLPDGCRSAHSDFEKRAR